MLTVTAANGCTATSSVVISEDKVPPTINVGGSPVLNCVTNNAILTANGGISYVWTSPMFTNMVLSTTNTFTATIAGTYIVTGTGSNGCTSTVQVGVLTPTPFVGSIVASPNTVLTCSNPSIVLSVTGSTFPTYNWSNGVIAATTTITTPGTYTVFIPGGGGFACSGTASIVITQDISAPSAAIIAPLTTILTCTAPNITLTATGAGRYAWSNGATNLGTEATQVATTVGIYMVRVTGTNGCTATATVEITSNLTPPIITATTNAPICAGNTLTLSTSSAATSYLWSGPNAFSSTDQNVSILTAGAELSGIYTLTITNASGCTATSSVLVNVFALPILVITNPASATSPATVDLTLPAVTLGSTLSVGTTLGYFTDLAATIPVPNAAAISVSGTYYIKATTAPGACVDIKPVVVTITTGCPDNLVLASPIDDLSGTGINKKAAMTISATNKVTTGANVGYQAGKSITLMPGMVISSGAVFKAEIKGCND